MKCELLPLQIVLVVNSHSLAVREFIAGTQDKLRINLN